jgi:hypothetical protein
MEIKYRTQFPELLEHLRLKGDAVEVGCAECRNAKVLISHPAITKLYMIDAWRQLDQSGDGGYEESWHSNNWKECHERVEPWKEKAVFLKGMSHTMIKEIPDDSLIFSYIDGDHSFGGCLSDLLNIYPKVKPGGVIALHDYENLSYGVNKAVRKFLVENNYRLDDLHTTEEDGDLAMVSCWFVKK